MQKKHLFRYILMGIAFILAIALFYLFVIPPENDSQITYLTPNDSEAISAYGRVGVTFTQAMDHASVEAGFSITPDVSGDFFWVENQFWFQPLMAFDPAQTYQAHLSGELLTADGQKISVNENWFFTIRQPSLIYFQPIDQGGELWLLDLKSMSPLQLTQTNGMVMDFAVDRLGNQIAYTVLNDSGGVDLWVMNRDGQNPQILLTCGLDVCSEPAWSADSQIIAYTREVYLPEMGGFQAGQVWTVTIDTRETTQLYQSEDAFGVNPSFSPDGRYLAIYDMTYDGIRILDLETSQESIIPRTLLGAGDWSPDGNMIVYTDLIPAQNEPDVVIYVADLNAHDAKAIFGESNTGTDFSQPHWSPDGNWVAVSLRPVNAGVSKALWLLNLNGNDKILIADEPSATFSAYHWDPLGDSLVYQRLSLGSPTSGSSIWLWDWETEESRLLVEDAARPIWLP